MSDVVFFILWLVVLPIVLLAAFRTAVGGGYQGSGDLSKVKPPKVVMSYLRNQRRDR